MKRKIYLDIAKIMACFAVIIQHNVSLDITDIKLQSLHYFYYYICRFAVPVFVMCTGALLLNEKKDISYPLIVKKYIPRIFSQLIIIVYIIELTDAFVSGTVSIKLLYQPIIHVVLNRVSVPYWYIYMIAGIYVLLPYIKKIVDHCSKKEIEIFLIIFIWVRSVAPFIDLCLKSDIITGLVNALQMSIFNGYIGYLILGYYVDRYLKEFCQKRYVICIIVNTLSVLLPLLILLLLPDGYDKVGSYFCDIFSPNIVLISVTLLLIIRRNFENEQKGSFFIVSLSKSTFGIYILHVYIQQLFALIGIIDLKENLYSGVLVLSIINFIISFLTVKIVQKCKKFLINLINKVR